jgi:hypothetical protein
MVAVPQSPPTIVEPADAPVVHGAVGEAVAGRGTAAAGSPDQAGPQHGIPPSAEASDAPAQSLPGGPESGWPSPPDEATAAQHPVDALMRKLERDGLPTVPRGLSSPWVLASALAALVAAGLLLSWFFVQDGSAIVPSAGFAFDLRRVETVFLGDSFQVTPAVLLGLVVLLVAGAVVSAFGRRRSPVGRGLLVGLAVLSLPLAVRTVQSVVTDHVAYGYGGVGTWLFLAGSLIAVMAGTLSAAVSVLPRPGTRRGHEGFVLRPAGLLLGKVAGGLLISGLCLPEFRRVVDPASGAASGSYLAAHPLAAAVWIMAFAGVSLGAWLITDRLLRTAVLVGFALPLIAGFVTDPIVAGVYAPGPAGSAAGMGLRLAAGIVLLLSAALSMSRWAETGARRVRPDAYLAGLASRRDRSAVPQWGPGGWPVPSGPSAAWSGPPPAWPAPRYDDPRSAVPWTMAAEVPPPPPPPPPAQSSPPPPPTGAAAEVAPASPQPVVAPPAVTAPPAAVTPAAAPSPPPVPFPPMAMGGPPGFQGPPGQWMVVWYGLPTAVVTPAAPADYSAAALPSPQTATVVPTPAAPPAHAPAPAPLAAEAPPAPSGDWPPPQPVPPPPPPDWPPPAVSAEPALAVPVEPPPTPQTVVVEEAVVSEEAAVPEAAVPEAAVPDAPVREAAVREETPAPAVAEAEESPVVVAIPEPRPEPEPVPTEASQSSPYGPPLCATRPRSPWTPRGGSVSASRAAAEELTEP